LTGHGPSDSQVEGCFEALARRDWRIRVFSGPILDFEDGRTNQQLLEDQAIPLEIG